MAFKMHRAVVRMSGNNNTQKHFLYFLQYQIMEGDKVQIVVIYIDKCTISVLPVN